MEQQPHTQTIKVVGAVIIRDSTVFCARRGEGKTLAGKWEFPGGKVEPGESPEQALIRELREEFLCDIRVTGFVSTTVYEYDFGTVELSTYYCELAAGQPVLVEHAEARWQPIANLDELDWAPADVEAVRLIMGGSR